VRLGPERDLWLQSSSHGRHPGRYQSPLLLTRGTPMRRRVSTRALSACLATLALGTAWAATASGASISSGTFTVQTGNFGEISSLQIVGDTFPTNYVINATNAPSLAGSADHHWFGELMFRYRLGTTTTWSTANS